MATGEEVGCLDADVGPEEVTQRRETTSEEIGFSEGLCDDDHGWRPVRGGGGGGLRTAEN